MSDPQTKSEIVEKLVHVQRAVTDTVNAQTTEQFNNGTLESWSAALYLQHLILTTKPFAKAMKLPPEQLLTMFGKPDHPSRSYADLVTIYKSRLDDGIRAEDFQPVTATSYRFPEGVEDKQKYLVETWNESNNRLFDALNEWSEEALDSYQIPHPAIGLITLREMLFFTVHHNTLHWHDIEYAGAQSTVK